MRWPSQLGEDDLDRLLRDVFGSDDNLGCSITDEMIERLMERTEGVTSLEGKAKETVDAMLMQRASRMIDGNRRKILPDAMSLGRFLERLRTKSNLTPRVFARFLDIPEQTYGQIENGKGPVEEIEPSHLVRIMHGLNLRLPDIINLLRHSLALERQSGQELTAVARSAKDGENAGAISQAMEDLLSLTHKRETGALPELDPAFLAGIRQEMKRQEANFT